jgi:tRNA modification GTPase
MVNEHFSIVTIATPRGRGAIATVLVSGANAAAAVGRFFLPSGATPLNELPLNRIAHGRWRDPSGEEIVVVRRNDDDVEIHCHGGEMSAGAILADLVAAGLQAVDWREWIERREPDPMAAAAMKLLPEATTLRTASILLDQANGTLRAALDDIDRFPTTAAERARHLLALAPIGLHLTKPWKVAIAGPPNAGKSSLVNALVGYQRSIVWDVPGTTRDVLSAQTAIDGWPVELLDTAGLRSSTDPLEAAGVERAREASASADLVLIVVDQNATWSLENDRLVADHPGALLVHAKCDLPSTGPRPSGIATSAKTAAGIMDLLDAISAHLVPHPPPPGAAVPFTPDLVAHLARLVQ